MGDNLCTSFFTTLLDFFNGDFFLFFTNVSSPGAVVVVVVVINSLLLSCFTGGSCNFFADSFTHEGTEFFSSFAFISNLLRCFFCFV